jgi:hypothetical protein
VYIYSVDKALQLARNPEVCTSREHYDCLMIALSRDIKNYNHLF